MALGGTFVGQVVLDPTKVAELLRGPQGPVMRQLLEDGQAVKQRAQQLVGVYGTGRTSYVTGDDLARRARQPGTLRDSIVTRLVPDPQGGGAAVAVGSEDPIALPHHEGTEPHTIVPVRAPRLVFRGADGTLVFALVVHHPGTRPNRYLLDALDVLRGRY